MLMIGRLFSLPIFHHSISPPVLYKYLQVIDGHIVIPSIIVQLLFLNSTIVTRLFLTCQKVYKGPFSLYRFQHFLLFVLNNNHSEWSQLKL
jgi:hypothetical protein